MTIRISIKDGRIVEGREYLKDMVAHMEDGVHVIHSVCLNERNSIEGWRQLYFYLRDLLHEEAETGYTKKELHELIKEKVLTNMLKNGVGLDWFDADKMWDEYRNHNRTELSTKFLSELGWREFVKRFKEWSQDNFGIYI